MTMLVFKTKGEIDRRSITTFGVSVKEKEHPIGIFGTGLKYAIAVILRLKGRITIYSGMNELKFGTKAEIIRGKTFHIITLNGKCTTWTTNLGAKWVAWEGLRELYCNSIDEREYLIASDVEPKKEKGYTSIVVECPAIEEAWAKRDKYFIDPEKKRLAANNDIEVLAGQDNYVYYKGIRIAPIYTASAYTYNLLRNVELTEDRTMKEWYRANAYVSSGVMKLTDKVMIRNILTCGPDYYEHQLNFMSTLKWTKEFFQVAENVVKFKQKCNESLFFFLLENSSKVLDETLEENNDVLEEAIKFCKLIGYPVDAFKIIPVHTLGGNLGMAIPESKIIYVSSEAFRLGLKQVTITILEEYLHLQYGLDDMTRRMQDFLVTEIVTLGARFTKTIL